MSTASPDEPSATSAAFDELVSSMPELAELGAPTDSADWETVTIELPSLDGSPPSVTVRFQVPTELAPMVRAELSPERVKAMGQVLATLAESRPPPS